MIDKYRIPADSYDPNNYYRKHGQYTNVRIYLNYPFDGKSIMSLTDGTYGLKRGFKVHVYFSRYMFCINDLLSWFVNTCYEITGRFVYIHVPKDMPLLANEIAARLTQYGKYKAPAILIKERRGMRTDYVLDPHLVNGMLYRYDPPLKPEKDNQFYVMSGVTRVKKQRVDSVRWYGDMIAYEKMYKVLVADTLNPDCKYKLDAAAPVGDVFEFDANTVTVADPFIRAHVVTL